MKQYGLIGKNLTYSYSKLIHDFIIKKYNLEASYNLIQKGSISKDLLLSYDGLNITIPYKEAVLEYLDSHSMPLVSCNTITNIQGRLFGNNTDRIGFDYLVKKIKAHHVKKVLILGSGGSSKMIQEYFHNKEVIVISRSDKVYNYDYLKHCKADILINATPIGMNSFESPVKEDYLKNFKMVIDLNYNPINSKLALQTKKIGHRFIGGLDMLIVQALASNQIWHGITFDSNDIQEIREYLLMKTCDKIALIGMPLAGKSTLVKEFGGVDLDDTIVSQYQEDIPSLLKNGLFRNYESVLLKQLVEENTKLIALGGGAILNHYNLELLKDYLIIFLDEDLEVLKSRYQEGIRPLLTNIEALETLYTKRYPLYTAYANIQGDGQTIKQLLEEWTLNENRIN